MLDRAGGGRGEKVVPRKLAQRKVADEVVPMRQQECMPLRPLEVFGDHLGTHPSPTDRPRMIPVRAADGAETMKGHPVSLQLIPSHGKTGGKDGTDGPSDER